jgi:hypothetical protein
MRPVATAHRPRPIWVTSIIDNTDHAITHDDMAAGITSRTGTYRALCRATVVPPAMTAPHPPTRPLPLLRRHPPPSQVTHPVPRRVQSCPTHPTSPM